jgi:deazaflavin-dependent oxidoreductase (nitroreductase family)
MAESQRSLTRPERAVHAFLMSRPGIWFGRYILPYLDRPLLYLSRGRYSMSYGQPILLLATTGAKSGRRRTTPLLYHQDGERIIVIASNGGRPRHPGWYYNLRATPRATVYAQGRVATYVAHEAQGEERARLWRAAVAFYAGYVLYETRATRPIPVMVLTPER